EHDIAREPRGHDGYRLGRGEGRLEDAGVRADADEGQHGEPGKADGLIPREGSLEPATAGVVVLGSGLVGVKEDVGSAKGHRCAGPSQASRRSPTLSRPKPGRSAPRSRGRISNGAASARVRLLLAKASRKASLTTSLNDLPEWRISALRRRTTSGSSVRVVR